ncbi:MAG: hypothetical protein RLZZ148_1880 [Cyanobacteriota bacterium]|jgi:hypothetical protein
MLKMMSGGRMPKRPDKKVVATTSEPVVTPRQESLNLTAQEILYTDNVELRRLLIERLGYEKFLEQVGGIVRHRDTDSGGERQLIYVPFEDDDDEPLMVLKVICPSTGHNHILRVPPYMRTCHQAAAWIAGFDNPHEYNPLVEC